MIPVADYSGVRIVPHLLQPAIDVIVNVAGTPVSEFTFSKKPFHSGVAGHGRAVLFASFAGGSLEIAAGAEGLEGFHGYAVSLSPLLDSGSDIGRKSLLEALFGIHEFGFALIAR